MKTESSSETVTNEQDPKSETNETVNSPEINATTDEKVTSEESSTSGKDAPKSMLDAVKTALKGDKGTEKSSGSEDEGTTETKPEAKAQADEEGDGSAELSEDDTNRLKPKTKKRIEFLSGQVRERDTTIATLQPTADKFGQIQRFVADAGLSNEDVNQGFAIMRDLKLDPQAAYAKLSPLMGQLEQVLGITLPADLTQAVQRGEITEAHARELSRSRGAATVTQQRLADTTARQTREQEQRQFDGRVDDAATAASDWERATSKGDPDWKLKQPRIQEKVEIEVMRRQARDPQYFPDAKEAVEISKKALADVETELKALRPVRKAVNTTPSGADAGSSSRAVAKPKSMLEAAKAGLERLKAG